MSIKVKRSRAQPIAQLLTKSGGVGQLMRQSRLIDQAQLPQSLDEALDEMEKSDLVADTLGDHLFSWFLRNKRREWNEYKAQVTPFELDRYYSSL